MATSRANTSRARRTYAFADMMFRQITRRPPADDAAEPAPIGGIVVTEAAKQQATQAGVPPYVVNQTARQIARWHHNENGVYPCGGKHRVLVTNGQMTMLF